VSFRRYVRKSETIERLRLVGPHEKSQAVMAGLYDAGYTLKQTGPYTSRAMFPKCDDKRFLFIAERVKERG
jgi:hypothetical protein